MVLSDTVLFVLPLINEVGLEAMCVSQEAGKSWCDFVTEAVAQNALCERANGEHLYRDLPLIRVIN